MSERTEWVERAEWVADGVAMLEIWFGQTAIMACYLVEGASRRAIIDTGTTGSPSQGLVPALARLDRRIDAIDLVLNTHGHIDHAWGTASSSASRPTPRRRYTLPIPSCAIQTPWHASGTAARVAAGDVAPEAAAAHTQLLSDLAHADPHFPEPDANRLRWRCHRPGWWAGDRGDPHPRPHPRVVQLLRAACQSPPERR
jgi:glyoxylase-like metal-dependent hydrolase (beta-lactamase superfamily II)